MKKKKVLAYAIALALSSSFTSFTEAATTDGSQSAPTAETAVDAGSAATETSGSVDTPAATEPAAPAESTDGTAAAAESAAAPLADAAAPAADDKADATTPAADETAAPETETPADGATQAETTDGAEPATDAAPATGATADTDGATAPEDPAGADMAAPAGDGTTQSSEPPTAAQMRATKWAEGRPEEDAIQKGIDEMKGLTVVDITYDGASDKTIGTAKAATHMKPGDEFKERAFNADRESIYNTGYFYDLYPTFEKVPEGVVITYHLLENPILQSVKIEGNESETDETLYGLVTVRTGTILNNRILHENIQAIQEQYKKDGYIIAKVTDMNIDDEGNLTIKINEGMLEGYKVKGNEKTKDYVILREMRQKVGTPFNSKIAKRSLQRVYNLGFFEDVNLKLNPGVAPNSVIMEIDVKEKRTGNFGIGAGYSSSDGIIGMVSVSDTNFRGTGDAVSFMYSISGDDTDAQGYTFGYRRPWLDSKETSATLRIYNRTYEYDDYDENGDRNETYMRKYSGGELTLSRPVSEFSTNYITLRSRKDKYVSHVEDGINNRSPQWIEDNFGRTNSITLNHVTDTRDNVYNPTEGGRIDLTGEFAGIGGDFTFQKFSIEDQRYFKAGHAQVWALRGMLGAGFGDLSYFNQFRLGGQSTIRGYREDQFRGDRMALLSLEYRFPLAKLVQGAIFTDWGSAWDGGFPDGTEIHGSIGVGLSLNTPLGPLRLDYGRGDDGGRVHFTVGGTF